MTKEIYLQLNMDELVLLKLGTIYSYIVDEAKKKLSIDVPNLNNYKVMVERYRVEEDTCTRILNVQILFRLEKI